MIALILNFKTTTPFFAQVITIVGEDISAITTTIDKQFCSNITLQLLKQEDIVVAARLNVNKYDYIAEAVVSTKVLNSL